MEIQNMFRDDINRKINGVIIVHQSAEDVVYQELKEYVITKELRKHFSTFFDAYSESFDNPGNVSLGGGVWISGFFGSGKSHFLKMLSYLLCNKEVKGEKPVEIFREKFSDDPAMFMKVDSSTRGITESILFNIDNVSPQNKDDSVVLRIFAKMFYRHLGYYGDNLKVARLEKYLNEKGKYDDFKAAFEKEHGLPWVKCRDAFVFCEDDVVSALIDVLGMSDASARNWFNGTAEPDLSIEMLASEIKEYVDSKPDNFRLLFMIDEVGQFIGSNSKMMLNLQSLVCTIGTKCPNKVWVMVTSQEAVDEVVKISGDDFSKIQGRFSVKLSLSSSSVDEVIQKRILVKTPEAEELLADVYKSKDSTLRNLFSFKTGDVLSDINGFKSKDDFVANYPFIPYQFKVMQNVFSEIRKHSLIGKHFSSGERSMLSAFQETAQKLQQKNEEHIVPFYCFYDSLEKFLDTSITNVIDRCKNASSAGGIIQPEDVKVLKLLYLIRYINDIQSTLDNITILMAHKIDEDKIALREKVKKSLDRLLSQNYISITGNTYNFLTNVEQETAREINNTIVNSSDVVSKIGSIIFNDICDLKKYRYKKIRDFSFEQMVDETRIGPPVGEMRLRFITHLSNLSEYQLISKSKENEAIIVLGDIQYYNKLEETLKIDKYSNQRTLSQMPPDKKRVVDDYKESAKKLDKEIFNDLNAAVNGGTFYVSGEKLYIKSGNAKSKIEQALEYLTSNTYSKMSLISKHADNDSDILSVLNGKEPWDSENVAAAAELEAYLDVQNSKNMQTSVADLQTRYSSKPYGWKETDIAAVIAKLIFEQKASVKYAGSIVFSDDKRLPDLLRKKSEIGKTIISKRALASANNMLKVKDILKSYFNVVNIPDDEDGLVKYVTDGLEGRKKHYEELERRYEGHNYPNRSTLRENIKLLENILSEKKDNLTLINKIIDCESNLKCNIDDLQSIEDFFKNQVALFDKAVQLESSLKLEKEYFEKHPDIRNAIDEISSIITVQEGTKYDYSKISKLNGLMSSVRETYDSILNAKREEVRSAINSCKETVVSYAGETCKDIVEEANEYYSEKEKEIIALRNIAQLDALKARMNSRVEKYIENIEFEKNSISNDQPAEKPPMPVDRQMLFPSKILKTDDDVTQYLNEVRAKLTEVMKTHARIQIR